MQSILSFEKRKRLKFIFKVLIQTLLKSNLQNNKINHTKMIGFEINCF